MANNLTLSVTLTGDNRQLSGTLKDAQGDVREFSATTERESKKAETALTAPGRSAITVSDHLRTTQREARNFGTETVQSGRQATQALTQASNEAQTTAGHLTQLKAVAAGVSVAFATMGVREFVADTYTAVSGSQQLQASLKTVTGSIQNASTAWDTLLGFAADTPFTLDQSVQGFIRMQSLGLNPTLEALRSYGNTSAAMGKDMMQMVEAVADATTGEFERLKEFGIRASKEGEQISFTFQGVTTTVANSANAISQYLQQIGKNQFAGAMADQMDTLSGKASNLEDTIYQFYLAIGDAGATEVFESTLANASNTVEFLTDNIDTLTSGAEVMAALIGGRVVVAFANATAAKLAATQQTIAYQLALARMAGVSGTAAAAQTALAGASRAAAGALTLVGGPVGAAMLAGGAIYYFREELGLVAPKVQTATDRVDDMTSALDANSEAALKNARAMLEAEQQFQQFRQATLAMDVSRQRQIVADEQRQWDDVGGQAAFGMGQRSESQQALHELQVELMNTRNAIDAAGGSVTEIDEKLAQLERTTRETVTPTADLGEANKTAAAHAKELAKSTQSQADALEDLYDRLIPGRRETVQLARDIQTLNLAIAMGTGNIAQNIQAMGLLQQQYIEAQNDTDDLADKTVKAAFTMEGAWDEVRLNGLRRLDDGFAELWESALDGSLNAGELMKKALAQTLAEMAHMAITRPITVQLATSMGFGGSAAGGQQAGGGLGSGNLMSMGKNAYNAVTGGFNGIQWGGAGGAQAYGGTGFANAATSGTGATGWMGGSMQNFQGMQGLAGAGAGFAGSFAAGSVFGKSAEQEIGSTLGALAGTYLAGPIGSAIGSFLGGGVGSLFGSEPTKFSGRFGTTASLDRSEGAGKDGVFEHQSDGRFYRETALGYAGFRDQGTERLQRAGVGEDKQWAEDLVNATAAMDALTVSVARSDEEIATMRDTVQGLEASGRNAGEIIEFALKGRALAALESIGHTFSDAVSSLPADEFTARLEIMAGGMGVLMQSADRLNLQFDATAAGALEAAGNLAQIAGGVENLAAINQGYYQATYTETERLSRSQAELRASLAGVTDQVPTTVAELRNMVEAQNLNDAAAGELAVRLMGLAPALKQTSDAVRDAIEQQYQESLGRAPDASGLDYWFNQVATGGATLERALSAIAASSEAASQSAGGAADSIDVMADALRERESLDRQLLQAQGNTDELRRRELEATDPSNRALQQRIWYINDEQDAIRAAQARQQERNRAIEQEASAMAQAREKLAGFSTSIRNWMDQLDGTEAGLGNPQQQLDSSDAAFWVQYEQALAGDRSAQQSITQYADRYIDNLKSMYASSENATGGIAEIRDAMAKLPEMLSPEQYISEEFKNALSEQTTALSATLDLNRDGTVSALEQVVASQFTSGQRLQNALYSEMATLGSTVLTQSQVRAALAPHATDAEIERLIRRVDVNGDGMIDAHELTNARLVGLAPGIAQSLAPLFKDIDIDASGFIDYSEFASAFDGMATDAQLQNIYAAIDTNGDGTISQLEAIAASTSSLVSLWAQQQPGDVQSAISDISRMYESALGRAPDLPGMQYWIDEWLSGASLSTIQKSINQHIGKDPGATTGGNTGGTSNSGNTGSGSTNPPAQNAPRPFWTRVLAADWTAGQRSIVELYEPGDQRAAALSYAESRGVKIPAYDTGAWDLANDQLAMVHAGEAIVPSAGGIADEFRAYASGDYQAELLSEIRKLQPASTRRLPPLPQFPLLDFSDVLQELRDIKRELKQAHEEKKRLMETIAKRTGEAGQAATESARRAEQQRGQQTEELQALNRAGKTRGRTV